MALIKCNHCGHMVSDRAKACPKCGNPIVVKNIIQSHSNSIAKEDKSKSGPYTLLGILAIVVLGLVVYFSSGGGRGSSSDYMSSSSCADTIAFQEAVIDSAVEATAQPEEVKPRRHHSSSYVCHSEYLDSEGDDGYDEGIDWGEVGATINNSYLEHDVNEGIKVHVNMSTSNLLGQQVNVMCRFWFQDGRQINSTDGEYEDSKRQVCTSVNVTPNYEECTWNDLQLFIPYTQIKRVRDWKHLKCRVEVYYMSHCLATGNYMHFGCWLE